MVVCPQKVDTGRSHSLLIPHLLFNLILYLLSPCPSLPNSKMAILLCLPCLMHKKMHKLKPVLQQLCIEPTRGTRVFILLSLSLADPETKSHYVYLKIHTALCESCTPFQIDGQKKILGLAKKQIREKKIKESRVGVNSSFLRIFIAKILITPAMRF